MSRSTFHLFSLPKELLETLTPRTLFPQDRPPSPEVVDASAEREFTVSGSKSCNICPEAVFSDVEDQRAHFRSDWHRYNVKIKLANAKVVSEAEFASLIEGLEDSLSSSDSSSDDDDDDDDSVSDSDAVQALLSKTRLKSRSPSPTQITNVPQSAITWFHSPPSTQVGIYKAIFSQGASQNAYLSELRGIQKPMPSGRKWAMFMVAGGHFAGVIVRVSRASEEGTETTQKGKQKRPAPEMEILRHKTFHRYTTRRKQGGSQSLNDQAKGNAKSAGAMLRRYGEQALRDDIRNLLSEWAEEISACERIWLRASTSNRRIFVDYDEAIIAKGDKRLRTFPFPTRRPTQAELSRCLMELTKVKVTHYTEEELKAQDEAFLASLPKPKPQPAPAPEPKLTEKKAAPPKLSREEEMFRDKWMRFLDMIKRGRLDAAKSFWEREGTSLGCVDASIPDWTGEKFGTLLQLAASSGQTEVTAWLLDDLNANPTIPVPSSVPREIANTESQDSRPATPDGISYGQTARTAYDIASTRAVRDVFRRSAGARPEAWDWLGAAHIPSMLSAEMEAERDSKKKERRKGLKDKIREREAREREKVKETEPEPLKEPTPLPVNGNAKTGPQRLGGAPTASQGLAGLTPEMRARIERERRARAAEARMKKT